MASSLVITVNSDRSAADLANRYIRGTLSPRIEAQAIKELFQRLGNGTEIGSFTVQSGSSAPVAATNTLTGVSVVATNTVVIGGVTFTYTASPTLETDVMVTVPTAVVIASGANLSATTGIMTSSAHGFVTGDLLRVSTGTTLPTGFAASTDYWVIKISDNTFKIASSIANSAVGLPIIPSTGGTGNQTFTLTANTYKAQKLSAAINAHSTISKIILATYAANVVTITALQKGVIGNFIAVTCGGGTITPLAALCAGGTGGATSAPVTYARS